MIGQEGFATHEVFNQPPPLDGLNWFTNDRALGEAVAREGAGWATDNLTAFGALTGSAEIIDLGRQANAYLPVLKSFDRFGHREDRVEFHPSYHELMRLSVGQGIHAATWEGVEPGIDGGGVARPGAIVARLASLYLMIQVEAGHICPITMTHASVPALLLQPELARAWLPGIVSRRYDPAFKPAPEKTGVTIGMGMTEKQGGTDVRANTTRAAPVGRVGGPGADYRLTGHKWFFSAPMCDAFLVLAQAPGGLTCFLLPRWTPEGMLNGVRLQRLKEKVGNRSNASSEVEFQGALAWAIGEEGRGVRNMLEMASYTRLDCAVASAGMMRQALAQALHHASYRSVFQKKLIDQPLMRQVLADLALEAEAATALAFRVAGAFGRAAGDAREAAYRRVMTPVAKYWVCKRAPGFAYEAMECLGGNGYVEESVMGRIYREVPVNAIWEGSGNVMCLDLLRALDREPEALEMVLAEFEAVRGADARYDAALVRLREGLHDRATLEPRAREIVEEMAVLASAAILLTHAPPYVADAYCASRLGGVYGATQGVTYGTLPLGADMGAILARAAPHG